MVASVGSHYAPRVALDRTVSAIASARRAVLAERYAINAFAVEWRWLPDLLPLAAAWRDLAARAAEANIFYEPDFALPAAAAFGGNVGAVLVWSGTAPRKLLGLFPACVTERRYGIRRPVLVGWTHPYAPLGTPLVERDAAEPVLAAWLAYIADNPALPGLVMLPLLAENGVVATRLAAILRRTEMPCADFARHQRAVLAPGDERSHYLDRVMSAHRRRELRRTARRLADHGALLFTAATEPEAVAIDVEQFFALEARGWKGEAGTAVADRADLRGFIKSAMAALAAAGKVVSYRILLDGRPIAAAITLRSGDAAWYWKTTYDESLARYAPGVLLTAALTEELVDDPSLAHTDSCAAPGNPMLDLIWRERMALCDRMIAVRPQPGLASAFQFERIRGAAIGAAKTVRQHLRRER